MEGYNQNIFSNPIKRYVQTLDLTGMFYLYD